MQSASLPGDDAEMKKNMPAVAARYNARVLAPGIFDALMTKQEMDIVSGADGESMSGAWSYCESGKCQSSFTEKSSVTSLPACVLSYQFQDAGSETAESIL